MATARSTAAATTSTMENPTDDTPGDASNDRSSEMSGGVSGAVEPEWTTVLYDRLRCNGYGAVAYVPDEGTGRLLPTLESDPVFTVMSVTREEEGIGVLTGAQLGGQRGALLIQASGVGNLINALASVNVACKIPLLLVIGERGGLHEFNPCQVPGGQAAPQLLAAIGVQTFRADRLDELAEILDGATTLAFSTRQPVGVILGTSMQKGRR